ncbi:MAG: TrkH family potassium uptake protein [Thermoguttaceae bacterium]|nr:TrkH family potassium uptake protein [Thermoguttaceae bacterium]
MLFCMLWGCKALGGDWRWEARGVEGLLMGAATSFVVAFSFYWFGRGANSTRLFRKEAIAIVAFGWILAIFLGATPYLYAAVELRPGVPATFADAIFESASGFTTTGATVFGELENPASLPRTILVWRFATHFLGGLGVMCFFVALIGHGANGKAIMKLERGASGNMPVAKMRELAFTLFKIYVSLNVLCALSFLCCGASFLDAVAHAFSTVATGGFSSRNASVAYFATDPNVNSAAFELTALFFMVVASTNYGLLYWVALRKPRKLFQDTEWRTYLAILTLAIIATFSFGWFKGDFKKTPVGEVASVGEIASVGEVASVGEIASVGEVASVGEIAPVGEIASVDEVASVGEVASTEGEAKVAERDVAGAAPAFPQLSGELTTENGRFAINRKNAKNAGSAENAGEAQNGENVATIEKANEENASESWLASLRLSAFTVVSLASGTGFAATRYELWNATSLCILAFVMFCGGCAASTAGGAKIYRICLLGKAILQGVERTHSPNVVRATRYNGENLERDVLNSVVIHLITLTVLILGLTLATLALEPDAPWADAPSPQIEKLTDMSGAALSMLSNVGPAFGKMGALENYGFLSAPTKLLYSCAMLVGRLEIWIVLSVFVPGFWRRN